MKRSLSLLTSVLACAALGLAGCSSDGGSSSPSGSASSQTQADANPGEKGFDVSGIKTDPEIAKLVPAALKSKGVLQNGASTDYPPAEFKKSDGQTATGYDVDMMNAIAKVMGLKGAKTTHADFDSLLPQIGSKFDVSASSFTITAEREQKVNMVSYASVGFAYGVPKGNPHKFDPKDVCGKTIGVQTGTAQLDAMQDLSKKCVADGKKAINLKPHKSQAEVTEKVVSGQYDATVADSPVIGYIEKQTQGRLVKLGDQFDTATHGIVVPQNQPELTKAVHMAVQKLMDDGTLKKIMSMYGAGDAALSKSEVNPKVK